MAAGSTKGRVMFAVEREEMIRIVLNDDELALDQIVPLMPC